MFNTFHTLKRRRVAEGIDGFTLIELLVILVVLGILAAVVLFALGGITSKSAVASCQADGGTLSSAISDFNTQNPGVTVTPPGLLNGTAANGNIPYIQSWPNNSPHYAYGVITGVLYVEAPYTTSWNATPSNGGTLQSGIVYTGPTSCVGVS